MLKKLKDIRDSLSEKTKLIIYASSAAAVFVFCCLFPLAFRGEIVTDGLFDTAARAEMFSRYMEKDGEIRIKLDEKPEKVDQKFCDKIFDDIYGQCILDKKSGKVMDEGQEFINITDGKNSMRLCRMWVQDQGDWNDWLDIYIDVDTGFIYYLYVSSVCISNSSQYLDSVPADTGSKSIADIICAKTGFAAEAFNWSGKPEDTATVITYSAGDAIIWKINCIVYPSSMIDIKICVA